MTDRSRVIFNVKPVLRGGGSRSELARYMAQSSPDKECEGAHPRPLFSGDRDDLTYWEAEQLITRGRGVAAKEDIKHLVISLRPRDYEMLGVTDDERRQHLVEISRRAVRLIADARGVSYLRWYGVVHLNEDNPHIHLGLGKNVIDRRTGRPTRLEHIPRELITRREPGALEDGEIVLGGVARLVADELDRRQHDRARRLQVEDHSELGHARPSLGEAARSHDHPLTEHARSRVEAAHHRAAERDPVERQSGERRLQDAPADRASISESSPVLDARMSSEVARTTIPSAASEPHDQRAERTPKREHWLDR